ncbi:8600_t:CDS:2 [Paraglomus occultum]|uniref:8600_t:CDS:1 n=1 Tax=Paraglomus occultum TaxID=144539 RepID=A0A9N9BRP0_9GLOM|nr:8600_t:CDS:2 [Paraglomus occultum]
MEAFCSSYLRLVTLHIIQAAGFDKTSEISIDVLTDIFGRYITLLGHTVTENANHAGRATPTILDLSPAFESLNIDMSDLKEWVTEGDGKTLENLGLSIPSPPIRGILQSGLVEDQNEVMTINPFPPDVKIVEKVEEMGDELKENVKEDDESDVKGYDEEKVEEEKNEGAIEEKADESTAKSETTIGSPIDKEVKVEEMVISEKETKTDEGPPLTEVSLHANFNQDQDAANLKRKIRSPSCLSAYAKASSSDIVQSTLKAFSSLQDSFWENDDVHTSGLTRKKHRLDDAPGWLMPYSNKSYLPEAWERDVKLAEVRAKFGLDVPFIDGVSLVEDPNAEPPSPDFLYISAGSQQHSQQSQPSNQKQKQETKALQQQRQGLAQLQQARQQPKQRQQKQPPKQQKEQKREQVQPPYNSTQRPKKPSKVKLKPKPTKSTPASASTPMKIKLRIPTPHKQSSSPASVPSTPVSAISASLPPSTLNTPSVVVSIPTMNDEEINCICENPHMDYGKFMIACDNCEVWYHGSCVGFGDGTDVVVDSWFCMRCRKRGESAKTEK